MKFKEGDRVRVVRGSGALNLAEGSEHTVEDVLSSGAILIKGGRGIWSEDRFELVETDYPSDLQRGDVMYGNGRVSYTVTNVERDYVTYAYVPSLRKDNKVRVERCKVTSLKWVARVEKPNGMTIWTKPEFKVGDRVHYKDQTWQIVNLYDGLLQLESKTIANPNSVRKV